MESPHVLLNRYQVLADSSAPGRQLVTVREIRQGVAHRLGAYERNHPQLGNTWHPFTRQGVDYALYAPDYRGTRILRLPDCVDLGGLAPADDSFCPVDYAVVWGHYLIPDPSGGPESYLEAPFDGEFALVAGRTWRPGRLSLRFLDLSRCAEGILTQDERLGVLEIDQSASHQHLRSLALRVDVGDWTPQEPLLRIEAQVVVSTHTPTQGAFHG